MFLRSNGTWAKPVLMPSVSVEDLFGPMVIERSRQDVGIFLREPQGWTDHFEEVEGPCKKRCFDAT